MSMFPTKILVATDGSEEAILAARTAADIADKTGSELHVVHVRMLPFYLSYSPSRHTASGHVGEDLERERKRLETKAQRLLDEQVRIIEGAGGHVAQAHLRLGRPDEEVTALAEEVRAGLIVMGSRGLGGTRRALMGNDADSVVRHAHCPVLIVRREEGRELPNSRSSEQQREA
jgi:nucleotide-binding universal stress UspA family protein